MWQDETGTSQGSLILQCFKGDSKDSAETIIYVLVEIRYNASLSQQTTLILD